MIDGDFFQSIAHVTWSDNMQLPDLKNIIMYAKTEDQCEAIDFINDRRMGFDEKYVLITHNSDCSSYSDSFWQTTPVDVIEMPNLVKWYACNLSHCGFWKIEPIPIGFENTRWHPKKRDILKRVKKEFDQNPVKRSLTPFACFNPKTYPQERENLQHLINNGYIDAHSADCVNGVRYEEYIRNLFTHRFCLCPRGNGIDTHRMWEALYCGCIPIVKPYVTHIDLNWKAGLTGVLKRTTRLPIVAVRNWLEVTEGNLLDVDSEISEFTSSDIPMLTTKFWQDEIEGAFKNAD
jgi:hypothetical protein